MFELEFSKYFKKKYKKLTSKNSLLISKIKKTLIQLEKNPEDNSIGSHKINSKTFGDLWSSRVTGDIRILWNYNKNGIAILLIDIGGHDEVYK